MIRAIEQELAKQPGMPGDRARPKPRGIGALGQAAEDDQVAEVVAAQPVGRLESAERRRPVRELFVEYAYALVPMGLSAWIAFTVSFVMVNVSYAIPLLSDPFGWGWNLLGTAGYPWTPYAPEWGAYVQAPILVGGLLLSMFTAYRIVRPRMPARAEALRALVPLTAFLVLVTMGFMRLYA